MHSHDAIIRDNDAARAWLEQRFSPTSAQWAQLDGFAARLLAEGERQNLIAASTRPTLWARHIADSAQLLDHVGAASEGPWLDLGSGAGLPGLIIAILTNRRVHLVESRRLRASFLSETAQMLGLAARVQVHHARLERLEPFPAAIISARAFAPLDRLVTLAQPFSHAGTVWVLPKGQSAAKELANMPRTWHKMFHVKPSLTDAAASLLVGQGDGTGKMR